MFLLPIYRVMIVTEQEREESVGHGVTSQEICRGLSGGEGTDNTIYICVNNLNISTQLLFPFKSFKSTGPVMHTAAHITDRILSLISSSFPESNCTVQPPIS